MTDLDRRKVTFEQAEGFEPLPAQLKPKELTKHLRAALWYALHSELEEATETYERTISGNWREVLRGLHVFYFGFPADEFNPKAHNQVQWLKGITLAGTYVQVFGLFQWILRHRGCPEHFADLVEAVLDMNKAGYRLVDGNTFVPVASKEEADIAQQAFAALNTNRYAGARKHLVAAAEKLSANDPPGSVREAMHAVESVARVIAQRKTFSDALAVFEQTWRIHPALKHAFSRLYGYTSDDPGIRHPLLDDANASVDDADALFMFGACAAFVTYLISKSDGTK